jgi:CopG family nickel-responsive transcriptional regulator
MSELVRFGVSLEQELLTAFDAHSHRKGFANRSDALRHCIRRELSEEIVADPHAPVAGVLTLVYDHHDNDLPGRLTALQHEAHNMVISTMHVHLDEHHCLETMALRGPAEAVNKLADRLRASRGVLQSSCALTAIEAAPERHVFHHHEHQKDNT